MGAHVRQAGSPRHCSGAGAAAAGLRARGVRGRRGARTGLLRRAGGGPAQGVRRRVAEHGYRGRGAGIPLLLLRSHGAWGPRPGLHRHVPAGCGVRARQLRARVLGGGLSGGVRAVAG